MNKEELFNQVMEKINAEYIPGTLRYVKASHPDLWRHLVEAEDRLEMEWLNGMEEGFKKCLDAWVGFNLAALKIFREREIQKMLL